MAAVTSTLEDRIVNYSSLDKEMNINTKTRQIHEALRDYEPHSC